MTDWAAVNARLDEFRGQLAKRLFRLMLEYYPELAVYPVQAILQPEEPPHGNASR